MRLFQRVASPVRLGMLVGLAVSSAVLGTTLAGCRARQPHLRVVLVTLDTLRQDAFLGERADGTPLSRTLAYAQSGAVFVRFYSASNVTQPTHASLFTGLHPWEHGLTRNGQILREDLVTVAEALGAEGFRTGAAVASFPLDSRFGFAQGFDEFAEIYDQELVPGDSRWEGFLLEAGGFYSLSNRLTERAIRMLDDLGGERQFFWFHYFDAHDPYGDTGSEQIGLPRLLAMKRDNPSFRSVTRRAHQLYHRDLAALDRSLDVLFERLRADAARIETHVVVTSDHGESFGESGHVGHGRSLAPREVRVPLFIVSPKVPPLLRLDVAGSVDIAATLVSLAGLDPGSFPGRDLTRPAALGAGAAFGMSQSPSVRRGRAPHERFFAVRDGVLFAGDPARIFEEDEAARPSPPAVARELAPLFESFSRSVAVRTADEAKDAETQRALRALGYAD